MSSVMGPLPVSADAMQQPTKDTLRTADKKHKPPRLSAAIPSPLHLPHIDPQSLIYEQQDMAGSGVGHANASVAANILR
jgi:hypothetical protein